MNLNGMFVGSKNSGKRVGRGPGSGKGKTSGRGTKGQKSRTGAGRKIKTWFEGGQTPVFRKLAKKRGFKNNRPKSITITTQVLGRFYKDGEIVSPETLLAHKIIRKIELGRKIKIVRRGQDTVKFQYQEVAISKSLK